MALSNIEVLSIPLHLSFCPSIPSLLPLKYYLSSLLFPLLTTYIILFPSIKFCLALLPQRSLSNSGFYRSSTINTNLKIWSQDEHMGRNLAFVWVTLLSIIFIQFPKFTCFNCVRKPFLQSEKFNLLFHKIIKPGYFILPQSEMIERKVKENALEIRGQFILIKISVADY